ncbi:LytTR family DNA-binding domain-containing protein [Flavitalea sp. BT771]|uniref:LytR/AlgR family response regulator transcription factor n=1 Tax=Flavitalea sp. BT771 TaxID=3063329 RepID=UPI0026E228FF|nr:LytTR family DNA-binding domain-containing protein [Flavitalea sp. BT771]MDO6430340.1 LytTR family DNA-binding domain-containing protein [Flavitalea sp. BT771]MDV6219520.1 LytTR family DNA-binding domain-containing protein [Flavitalea sp. BT771]
MMVNCIAIDDEPLALSLVSTFIEQTPFLRLKGCYGNVATAFQALCETDVQLIFLDIQMPDISGMQLARILSAGNMPVRPRIIFTTAYNHYAIEGYKVDAVDYLLKPFNYDEFLRAANRARLGMDISGGVRPAIPQANPPGQGYLFVKADHQLVKVDFGDVRYVEAFRDYIKVYTVGNDKPVMSLATLKSVEEKLPAGQFLRVHKSFIVSLAKIDTITKSSVHVGNVAITIGNQYREGLRRFIDRWTI